MHLKHALDDLVVELQCLVELVNANEIFHVANVVLAAFISFLLEHLAQVNRRQRQVHVHLVVPHLLSVEVIHGLEETIEDISLGLLSGRADVSWDVHVLNEIIMVTFTD